MPYMAEALRSAKVTTALTPEMKGRLASEARQRRWSVSVAAAVAVEHWLSDLEAEREQARGTTAA